MKKKTLKILSFISALSIMAGLFSGCGGKQESDIKTATIWMNYGHSKHYWEKKIEQFNKEMSKEVGVELVLDAKNDDNYSQALGIAKKSNQLPEFFTDGSCKESYELDIIYPISELPGMESHIEKYSHLMVENTNKIGDKIYSLPFGITTRGLIYNKDMFKAAGIVDENGEPIPPKTFDELREVAKKLTDESKNQYGIIFPVKWSSWVESDITTLAYSNSGRPAYDPVTGIYDYSVYEPIIEMIMGIKEDGSCYPGAEGLDNDPARAKFSEGNIGMKISYSFDVGVLNEQFPAKMDWGVAPLPVEDINNCYNQHSLVGSSVQVSKTGVEKIGEEAASKILQYLYSDEVICELYKEGLELPCIWETVKDVKLGDDAPKGWKEFAELSSKSVAFVTTMPTDMQGKKGIKQVVVEDIWTGKVKDVKGALAELSKISNEGIKVYQEIHPNIDYSIYIDEDWADKVRREQY